MLKRFLTKPQVQFITDIEGSLAYFLKVIANGDVLTATLLPDRHYKLDFKRRGIDYFVCGGDICDRGDSLFGGGDIRIARALIDLKQRHKENVVLLIGNRDANKMRFAKELRARHEIPSEDHPALIGELKLILETKMGAPGAFEYRRKELAALRGISDCKKVLDSEVYDSFRQSIEPGPHGFMRDYLALGQLAWMHNHVLYTHGGVLEHQIGQLPDKLSDVAHSDVANVNCGQWIEDLNHWGKRAFEDWLENPSKLSLCDYATGEIKDRKEASISITTTKYLDDSKTGSGVMNPITAPVASFMTHNKVHLLVTGHQPHGDTPCLLVGTDAGQHVAYLNGDTLYSHYHAYDPNDGKVIRLSDPRGQAYNVIQITDENNGFSVSIKGQDSLGVEYGYNQLLTSKDDTLITCDPYIGRKLTIDGKEYIVRLNAPHRALIQTNIIFDSEGNVQPADQPDNPHYILSTIKGNEPILDRYTVLYKPVSEATLRACEQRNQFFNKSLFFRSPTVKDLLVGTKLVIFDIDLTVIDNTTDHYWRHLNTVRADKGLEPWKRKDYASYFNSIKPKGWISREHIISRMLELEDENHPTVQKAMAVFYRSFEADCIAPELFPFVDKVVKQFKENGIPVLALSDTEERLIRHMLSSHDLHEHFDAIKGKANKSVSTQVFCQMMKENGYSYSGKELLVIGDSLGSDGKLAKDLEARFLYFIGDRNPDVIKRKEEDFQKLRGVGIPRDSVIIKNYQQLLELIPQVFNKTVVESSTELVK